MIFSREVIEGFAQKPDEEVIKNAHNSLSFIIEQAITDLRKRNSFLSEEYEIVAVNEFFSGAILPGSELSVFLVINSPQIEFNTVQLTKNKFKAFWKKVKYAWKTRKKTKKNKKKDKYLNNTDEELSSIKDKAKYNLLMLNMDLLNSVSKFITNEEMVTLSDGCLKIVGDVEPFPIKIKIVIKKGNSYNYYSESKNKFINIDFKERQLNLEKIIENYGENYLSLCRIFASLYFNVMNIVPNAVFIESLVANLPAVAFAPEKSIYENFVFSVNYLLNSNLSNLFSITNPQLKIFNDKACETTVMDMNSFFKALLKII